MIWHFVEIWALLFVAFALGCVLGVTIYSLLARSGLATAQGAVADAVGDVVDNIKARLGVGPVWRPEYRHLAERSLLGGEPLPELAPPDEQSHAADEPGEAEDGYPLPENGAVGEEEPVAAADDAPAAETAAVSDQMRPPLQAEPVAATDDVVAARPVGLAAPRNGVPDNLQKIRGVGARNEQLLNSLGIFHFGQIAAWTPAEVKWIAERLSFPERIERDDWIGQATILASGGDTGFSKSAARRRARRRQQSVDVEDGGRQD